MARLAQTNPIGLARFMGAIPHSPARSASKGCPRLRFGLVLTYRAGDAHHLQDQLVKRNLRGSPRAADAVLIAVALHRLLKRLKQLAILAKVLLRHRHLASLRRLDIVQFQVAENVDGSGLAAVVNLHDLRLVAAMMQQIQGALEPVGIVQVADDDGQTAPLVAVDKTAGYTRQVRVGAL